MSTVLNEVLSANASYANSFGSKADLALPPARRFAILTCMDARLDPAKYAGLREKPYYDEILAKLLAANRSAADAEAAGRR